MQHQLPGVLPAVLQGDTGAEGALHGRDLPRPAGSEILPGEIQRGKVSFCKGPSQCDGLRLEPTAGAFVISPEQYDSLWRL